MDTRNEYGATALHAAVKHVNLSQVLQLISQGYDVNARNNTGETPLHYLIMYPGQQVDITEVLSCLVANGADVNATDDEGVSIILTAVMKKRSIAVIEQLINYGAEWKNGRDKRGLTILHTAVLGKNVNALQLFLSLGAEVNAKCSVGCTPLAMAVLSTLEDAKLMEMMKLLVDNGANVNEKEDLKCTILLLAVGMGRSKAVLKHLVDNGAEWKGYTDDKGLSVLHHAAFKGYFEALDYFLSLGANPNELHGDGLTPLHLTAMGDMDDKTFLHSIKLLKQNGANILAKDGDGDSVLFTAVARGQKKQKLERLLELGAVWNDTNNDGQGILEVAVKGDNLEAFNLFIEKGADVHAEAEDGESVFNSALLSMATQNEAKMREILKIAGVVVKEIMDVNIQDFIKSRDRFAMLVEAKATKES